MSDEAKTLQRIIDKSENIVFFGGAGVSTESGLKDFRSVDGLYSLKYDYPPEEILSHNFFFSHTAEFFRFYYDKLLVNGIKPNAAHYKVAELERAGKLKAVVTQNIDGLHQAAGSKVVYELHGSVKRNRCFKCNAFYDDTYIAARNGDIPYCACGGIVKPEVVLYGEGLDDATVNGAINAIIKADTLIVAGTSLSVYPASALIDYFRGKYLVLINKGEVMRDIRADLYIDGKVGETLKKIKV